VDAIEGSHRRSPIDQKYDQPQPPLHLGTVIRDSGLPAASSCRAGRRPLPVASAPIPPDRASMSGRPDPACRRAPLQLWLRWCGARKRHPRQVDHAGGDRLRRVRIQWRRCVSSRQHPSSTRTTPPHRGRRRRAGGPSRASPSGDPNSLRTALKRGGCLPLVDRWVPKRVRSRRKGWRERLYSGNNFRLPVHGAGDGDSQPRCSRSTSPTAPARIATASAPCVPSPFERGWVPIRALRCMARSPPGLE